MSYNRAFETLVENDEDVTGMLAYALYKRHKRAFIRNSEQVDQDSPNAEQLAIFVQSSLIDDNVRRLKDEARGILTTFAENYVADVKAEIRVYEVERANTGLVSQNLQEFRNYLKGETKIWKTIGMNVLGSFIYSIVLAIIAVIIVVLGGGDLIEALK